MAAFLSNWRLIVLGCVVGAVFLGCRSHPEPRIDHRSRAPKLTLELEREKPGWCKATVKNVGLQSTTILKPDVYGYMPPFGVIADLEPENDERVKGLVRYNGRIRYTSALLHSQTQPAILDWPRVTLLPNENYVYRFSVGKLLMGVENYFGDIPKDCAITITAQITALSAEKDWVHGFFEASKELPFEDW